MGMVKSGKLKGKSRIQNVQGRSFRLLVTGCWLLVAGFHPALGQEWTFSEPEKLPSTINTAAEEGMPLLSPDGKTLYFTRLFFEENMGGEYAGTDIWVSRFDGVRWSKAEPLDGLNNRGHNAVVGISADSKTLFLVNASSREKMNGIYFTRSIQGKWSVPELIPIEGLSNEGFLGFYVSPDFEVILISMKGADSKGEEDLYVSLKDGDGRWSKPKNLGPTINTAGFEVSPFLTSDRKYLFFSSNGHTGLGEGDVFYAERLYNSWETWAAPKNIGTKINSKHFDAFFTWYGDTLSYFATSGKNSQADLYAVRARLVDIIKQRPLTTQERKELLGFELPSVISFRGDSADLLSSDTELLWYIAGKLLSTRDIKIRIDVASNKNDTLIQKRIAAITTQLTSAGLEESRVLQPDFSMQNKTLSDNQIALTFVR